MRQTQVEKRRWRGIVWVAIVLFLLLLTNVLSYYVGQEQRFPRIVLTANLLCVFFLVPYLKKGGSTNTMRRLLTGCFVLMMIMSLLNFSSELSLLTVFVIFCLMTFGTYSREWDIEFLNKTFLVLGAITLPILIWQLLNAQINIAELLKRRYTWTEIFAYATFTRIWIPMLMLSFLTRKGLLFSLVFWAIAVVFNMISLKRSIVVDTAIVFLIILVVSRKIADKKTKRYLYLVFIMFALIAVYIVTRSGFMDEISDIGGAVSERFTDSVDDVGEFDRWVESKNYFTKEATIMDDLLGKGWFSVQHGIVNRDRGHAFLHIGWLNFIFKGGIFFLIVVLIGYRRVFQVILHPDHYSHEKVFEAMFCMFYFFNFFYSHVMSLGIDLFLFFYCLVHVNDRMVNPNNILLTNQSNQG